jgi:hypothetical protein
MDTVTPEIQCTCHLNYDFYVFYGPYLPQLQCKLSFDEVVQELQPQQHNQDFYEECQSQYAEP